MRPLREPESALLPPLRAHFERAGYVVSAEVRILWRRCDLLAASPAELVAVELKRADWREALVQARAYQLGADRTYVALPFSGAVAASHHRYWFDRDGIGLFGVRRGLQEPSEIFPARHSPRQLPALREGLWKALRKDAPEHAPQAQT